MKKLQEGTSFSQEIDAWVDDGYSYSHADTTFFTVSRCKTAPRLCGSFKAQENHADQSS